MLELTPCCLSRLVLVVVFAEFVVLMTQAVEMQAVALKAVALKAVALKAVVLKAVVSVYLKASAYLPVSYDLLGFVALWFGPGSLTKLRRE